MRIVSTIFFLCLTIFCFSQKTDVVVVKNGDHITGEVKSLQNNMLTFKTDDMGTLNIKWDKVQHIVSSYTFRVELKNGAILLGSLDSTEVDESVRIKTDSYWTEVKSEEVVGILKINNTILGRIDGEVGLGYSFTKSSGVHSVNGKFNVSYLANRNLSDFKSNAIFTSQQDTIFTSKADMVISQTRLFNNHMFTSVSWALQQNSELGIERRSLGSVTYGKNFIRRNRMLLLISTGLAGNNERYFAKDNGEKDKDAVDLEGVFKLEFRSFSNNEPEFNIHPYVIVYPSLTNWGRVRSDFNMELSFELIHDLMFKLTYYNQFDSQPPSGGTDNDYGIVTSFNYIF